MVPLKFCGETAKQMLERTTARKARFRSIGASIQHMTDHIHDSFALSAVVSVKVTHGPFNRMNNTFIQRFRLTSATYKLHRKYSYAAGEPLRYHLWVIKGTYNLQILSILKPAFDQQMRVLLPTTSKFRYKGRPSHVSALTSQRITLCSRNLSMLLPKSASLLNVLADL